MLRSIARALFLRRLLQGSRHPRRSSYGHRGRHGRGGGFGMWGPLPSYSRRTRRGSRVRVTGCCLPIPLALVLAPPATYAAVRGRRRRR